MTWGNFKEDSLAETYRKMKAEELKGNQHKLDKNKNGKLDSDDFKKLRKEDAVDEAMNKADIPAVIRKKMGEKPLTLADLKAAPKDSISHPDNLAKARGAVKEDIEELEELSRDALKAYVNKAKPELKTSKEVRDSARQGGDGKTANDMYQLSKKRAAGIKQAKAKLNKEDAEVDAEELVEYETKDGVYKHQAKAGRYGGSEKESDYVKGPSNAELKKIEAEKKNKLKKEELDIFSEREIDILISEVLKASDDAGKWISDFVSSDNPKFAGKSKADRKKQALAAYYAAQKKESVEYDSFIEEEVDLVKTGAKEIKHSNIKDKDDDKDTMEPRAQGERDFLDKLSVNVTDDPAAAAGNDQTGSRKVSSASKPNAQGAGKYDGKGKTGVKEDTSESDITEAEDCSCEKNSTGKKSYTTFKEKMNKKGC